MSSEILTRKQKKARKPHKCWLCGKTIIPGAEYVYETYVHDRRIYTSHMHIHCEAMMDAWILNYGHESEYDDDAILDGIYEYVCREICDDEQQDECGITDSLSCELCQRKLLEPCILETAIQSVRDSMGDFEQ